MSWARRKISRPGRPASRYSENPWRCTGAKKGGAVALADRCPHRFASLSAGRIVKDPSWARGHRRLSGEGRQQRQGQISSGRITAHGDRLEAPLDHASETGSGIVYRTRERMFRDEPVFRHERADERASSDVSDQMPKSMNPAQIEKPAVQVKDGCTWNTGCRCLNWSASFPA